MFLKKCIDILNTILKDIIWNIYDGLYKEINNLKINKKTIMRLYIKKTNFCLKKLYKSNVDINDNLKILIKKIIDDIKIKFFVFKKEIIQIIEIENIEKYNLYYFNYLYYM